MNQRRKSLKPGLYALTPTGWSDERLLAAIDQVIAGGAVLIQYRDKPQPNEGLARAILARCHKAGIPLIINDDVELAVAIGADGVHLGRDDAEPEQARARLGDAAIIGVSCYNDVERARQLAPAADYLAFGSVFASPTKPNALACPLETLSRAAEFGKPVVAIGGLTAENAPGAIAAGANLVAVITDLFDSPDIERRAGQYQSLFQR